MPRKIRELLKEYSDLGAKINLRGGKGSHRKISHPALERPVTLSGKDGADAKCYQEDNLKTAKEKIDQWNR